MEGSRPWSELDPGVIWEERNDRRAEVLSACFRLSALGVLRAWGFLPSSSLLVLDDTVLTTPGAVWGCVPTGGLSAFPRACCMEEPFLRTDSSLVSRLLCSRPVVLHLCPIVMIACTIASMSSEAGNENRCGELQSASRRLDMETLTLAQCTEVTDFY